jgi:hypothetical protein
MGVNNIRHSEMVYKIVNVFSSKNIYKHIALHLCQSECVEKSALRL